MADTDGPTVTTTFTVPVTGAVLVTLGFMGNTAADGQWSRMSATIRKEGALVVDAHEVRSAVVSSKLLTSVSTTFRVTGLQAGAVYTAVSAYCSSATSNKGWYDNRFIRVDPLV